MKKLWLTYAWKDNDDRDIDFIIHELEKTDSIEVKFDRRNLVPGQRLWDQIGTFITDPDECDAWGIILTPNSIVSQACIEELSYALDRALNVQSKGFPLFALLYNISASEVPPALKIRLGILLEDPNWVQKTVAAVKKLAPSYKSTNISRYVVKKHKTKDGFCLEMRPRFEKISPFFVAVDYDEKKSGNIIKYRGGPAGRPPGSFIGFGTNDFEAKLPDETRVWVWKADNEANSTYSYYLYYKRDLKRVWCGKKQEMRKFMLTDIH